MARINLSSPRQNIPVRSVIPFIRKPLNKYFRSFDNETTGAFPRGGYENLGNPNGTWLINDTVYYGSGKSLEVNNSAGNSAGSWLFDEGSVGSFGDGTLVAKVRMTLCDNTQMRVGIMARCTRTTGYCLMMRADLNNATFRLSRFLNASETTITTSTAVLGAGVQYEVDTWYYIKFYLGGSTLKGKIWKVGTTEPDWIINTTDSTYGNTLKGVGYFTFIGTVAGTQRTYWDDVYTEELNTRSAA